MKRALILFVLVFLTSHSLYALERDLINGPGYADIKDITVRLKGDLTSLTVKFFEPLPTGISLVGRLYVDYDANASTGCNWPNEKGADYLAVFTQTEGALFEWKRNRFERIGSVSVSFLGDTIAIDIPAKYTPRGARIKLWTRTTITDPITRSFLKLSALTRNYTIILADGADNLPGWMDLLTVRGMLKSKLRLIVVFREEAMPMINGSSIDVVASHVLMIDADGDPDTGLLGAEYSIRLIRLTARSPFLELIIAGELYKLNLTTGNFDILISEFPGYLSGSAIIYNVPLKEVKLTKESVILSIEPPIVVITDYFPDGYFKGIWLSLRFQKE